MEAAEVLRFLLLPRPFSGPIHRFSSNSISSKKSLVSDISLPRVFTRIAHNHKNNRNNKFLFIFVNSWEHYISLTFVIFKKVLLFFLFWGLIFDIFSWKPVIFVTFFSLPLTVQVAVKFASLMGPSDLLNSVSFGNACLLLPLFFCYVSGRRVGWGQKISYKNNKLVIKIVKITGFCKNTKCKRRRKITKITKPVHYFSYFP